MLSDIARHSLPVMAVLMLAGGYMGYKKAGSKASLIAALISFLFYAAAYYMVLTGSPNGIMLGLGISIALAGTFVRRLIRTKKFMPSGMLLILCTIEAVILFLARSST